MGDTDLETMANVTIAEYDYEDEAFNNVSDQAKDFVEVTYVQWWWEFSFASNRIHLVPEGDLRV